MSAPEGTPAPIPKEEAVERIDALCDDDRTLQGILYTGGSTEYAHIYLATVTGRYNGHPMLWFRYVWLSKPGAFESDMWGDNGISIRLVDGLANPLASLMAATINRYNRSETGDEPFYTEVEP